MTQEKRYGKRYSDVGPYDLDQIGVRLNDRRVALGIHVEDELCPLIRMSKGQWSAKMRGKQPLFLQEINAILWAFERLRPAWRCPPGFPFIPEEWATRLDTMLPSRKHPSGDHK